MGESDPTPFARGQALALGTAILGLALGTASLGAAWLENGLCLAAFGLAVLFQAALAFNLRARIREGFGNRGLQREHRLLRIISHLQRLGALGLILGGAAALMAHREPSFGAASLVLASLAAAITLWLWRGSRALAAAHPAFRLAALHARLPLEGALTLLVATLVSRGLPQADAVAAILLALRLAQAGFYLGKATSLAAACGGCGSGCGCG